MNNKMNFIILIGICLFMLINPNNCLSNNAIHNDDLVRSSFSVIEPCQFENDIDSITVLYWNAWGCNYDQYTISYSLTTGQMDSTCYEPKNLKYFRKRLVIQNGCRKEVFSGCVEGDIVCPYVVHPERVKKFPKSYIRFYNRFASCHYLFGIAASLEKDMSQFVYSHVFVNGFIDYGKETGEWQFRYTYEDTDFLFMTANYKNGKLEGKAKFYKPDGRLYQEAEFEKGKLVLRIWYNEEGEIIYKDYYKNDKLIRTEQYAKDPRSF